MHRFAVELQHSVKIEVVLDKQEDTFWCVSHILTTLWRKAQTLSKMKPNQHLLNEEHFKPPPIKIASHHDRWYRLSGEECKNISAYHSSILFGPLPITVKPDSTGNTSTRRKCSAKLFFSCKSNRPASCKSNRPANTCCGQLVAVTKHAPLKVCRRYVRAYVNPENLARIQISL